MGMGSPYLKWGMTSRAAFSTVDGSWSKATCRVEYDVGYAYGLVFFQYARTHCSTVPTTEFTPAWTWETGIGVAFFEGGAGLGLGFFARLCEVDVEVDGVGEFSVLPAPLPTVAVYLAIHLGGFGGVGVGGEEAVAPPSGPSEDGRGVAAEPDGGVGPLEGSGAEGVVGELERIGR